MIHSLMLNIAVCAGLWPFGGATHDTAGTIKTLEKHHIELPVAEQAVRAPVSDPKEQYRAFLELPDGDASMRAEAMRRLGDLNMEAGQIAEADTATLGSAAAYYADAIALYQRLLHDYPENQTRDGVLYQLARAYELSGAQDAALQTLDSLVNTYPDGAHLDEAQFRRGEILFVRQDYAGAAAAYQGVTAAGPDSDFYSQSVYKLGWALFKQSRYDASTAAFMAVLDSRFGELNAEAANEYLETLPRADRELVDDTLRVLSLTFSYEDGAASIGQLLDSREQCGYSAMLYAGLGQLYLDKERYLDAAETYSAFIEREPLHPNAPAMQTAAIDAYLTGNFPSLVLEAKEKYVIAYGLRSDYWMVFSPAERPDVVAALKQHLGDLAQHDHALAQETHDPAQYRRAADWYRRYLDYFPEDPASADRSFLLAEILTESGVQDEASQFFRQAAYRYPGYPRAAEAAYAGLLAAKKHEASLTGPALLDWQAGYQRDALQFAGTFPGHIQAAPVLSNVAEELYAAGRRAAAIRVAGRVLEMQPAVAPELQRVSWTVVGHGHFELQQYRRAEQAYTQLRQMGGSPALGGAELEERIAASVYRQAEERQSTGDTAGAVAQYLRVAQAAPASKVQANALYDASALLLAKGEWQQSINVLTDFRARFPQHEFSDDVTKKLAVAQLEAGNSTAAAAEFGRVAAIPGLGADLRREALWRSAELYAAAGQLPQASAAYESFAADYPSPLDENMEALHRLSDIATGTHDSAARSRWLRAIIAEDDKAGAARTDRSRFLAANAVLELAEPGRIAFNAAHLTAPLQKSLQTKKQLMEQSLAAYNSAANYGVQAVTTVATYRIGEIYYQLSQDLMASDRPAGLSDEELEQYTILLEEQAFPFEEKAIEIFEINASRAADNVWDEWVRMSFARLAELVPARYAKAGRGEGYVATLE